MKGGRDTVPSLNCQREGKRVKVMILKIGETELNIKYGFEATIKSGIIKKISEAERPSGNEETLYSDIEKIMLLLPELILVGLQKFHNDEYGYDYETNHGKNEKLEKVYSLLDDYFDSEGADFNTIFGDLQSELLNNGFLANVFRQELMKAEQETKKAKKTKN